MRKIFAITVAGLLLPIASLAAAPLERKNAEPSPLDAVSAHAVVVLDHATGVELLSRRAADPWPIASITKLLTAVTLLEAKPNLQKTITMQRADEVGGARLRNARPGVRFRTEDLLAASLVGSANNASVALARAWGPGVKAFVARMNKTAKNLGLAGTFVRDPTGMSQQNIGTARDVSLLLRKAYARPHIASLLESKTRTIAPVGKGAPRTIQNTNKLLGNEDGFRVAGKTGFINESGYNFASRVDDGSGRALVIVLLGNASQEKNFSDIKLISEWVWHNFEWSTGG